MYAAPLGEDEVVCRGCHRISPVEEEWCAGCGRRLRLPTPVAPPRAPAGPVRICPRCRRGNPEDAEVCFDCGGRFPGSAARPETPPAAPAAPDGLPCPGCGTKMEAGTAFLDQGTFWDQLFADRHGWIPLVFRRHEALEVEPVIQLRERAQAQRCPACNSVWISPPPPR